MIRPILGLTTFAAALSLALPATLRAQSRTLPNADQRSGPPKTLDTLRTFPDVPSQTAWEERAREIRQHVLVSCGLWPLPEKCQLDAKVFGRIERDGYSVEKVQLQTYPGFYLAGNLYRPLGKGPGPFPAILNPHGHWEHGRYEDSALGSIPGRCINFARQGMVAFSIDMVGYGDTHQAGPHRKYATDPANLLWNISLMGLQTWNAIRSVDFLVSLPDVDRTRLGCTGASGGGTQTFILGAIDDRISVLAPMVMVSHSMQGGCLCENAPGLRVDYSNMEIAAAAAPRPQLLVAASGDWTKTTMTVEGPSVEKAYRLFNQADHLRYVLFDLPHNYNQTTREEAYRWFGKWLLHQTDTASIHELPFKKEADENLRVWPEGQFPKGALDASQLIAQCIRQAQERLHKLTPTNPATLKAMQDNLRPLWRHGLQVEFPNEGLLIQTEPSSKKEKESWTPFVVGRAGKGDRIPGLLITPQTDRLNALAILAHANGKAAYLDEAGKPKGLARRLLDRGCSIILADTFLTGTLANENARKSRDHFLNFFPTYNRTDLQERVQDLVTLCAFAHSNGKGRSIVLCGEGQAGLWTLLAAPAADAVAADANGLDLSSDKMLLTQDLFSPGLHLMGAFDGAAALAAPRPLLLQNTGPNFPTPILEASYHAAGTKDKLRRSTERMKDEALADWILRATKK